MIERDDLDRELLTFLRDMHAIDVRGMASDLKEVRMSLEEIRAQQHRLGTSIIAIEHSVKSHEQRITALEEAEEVTGSHELAELRRQRDDAKSNTTRILMAVASAIGALLLLGLGGAGTVIWYLITNKP